MKWAELNREDRLDTLAYAQEKLHLNKEVVEICGFVSKTHDTMTEGQNSQGDDNITSQLTLSVV